MVRFGSRAWRLSRKFASLHRCGNVRNGRLPFFRRSRISSAKWESFTSSYCFLEKWLESLDEPVAESLLSLTVELNALIDRLELAAATLGEIFGEADAAGCAGLRSHPAGRGSESHLKQAPVNVATLLRERLFEKLETVILTSATLTTEKRFDYVKGRLGTRPDATRAGAGEVFCPRRLITPAR